MRAAVDSDIPGIPLPGSTVEGSLGGPIYDHVYSVSVPAQHVLLASMTGTPGTDFDLYLYDTTATTVWADTGLLASSTGPTSTETISWPSLLSTTYYIDLHGFSQQEGTFHLTVAILADTTPPRASISIAGGAAAVNTTSVTLTIQGTDDLSGVDAMQLSSDGLAWTDWQPYQTSLPWTLAAGDGPKQVWVRVRDRAGNVSAPASARTLLDTVSPQVVEVSPPASGTSAGLRPVFTVKFDSPIQPSTWLYQGLRVQLASTGVSIPGSFAYDEATWRGSFRPASDLIAGAPYQVSLGDVRDPAGNPIAPVPPWTVTPLAAAALALTVGPANPPYGLLLSIAGSAVLPSPAAVQVERRYVTASEWTPLTAVFPGAGGQITMGDVALGSADYRLHYPGGPTAAEGFSSTVRVVVHSRVELAGLTPGKTVAASAGRAVTLRARVAPAAAGMRADFRLYRYDAVRRAYVLVATYTRTTDASGRATLPWKPRPGRWQVHVATRATPDLAAGLSPSYVWLVR